MTNNLWLLVGTLLALSACARPLDSILDDAIQAIRVGQYFKAKDLYAEALLVEDNCAIRIRRAKLAEIIDDYKTLETDLSNCLDDPSFAAEASEKLAPALLKLGEFARAAALFQDRALQEALPDTYARLQEARRLEKAYAAELPRNKARALELLNDIVRIAPKSTDLLLALADLYIDNGRPIEAESTYKRALRGGPARSDAYIGVAVAQAAQGRSDQVVQTLKAALDLDPDSGALIRAWKGVGAAARCLRDMEKNMDVSYWRTALRAAGECLEKAERAGADALWFKAFELLFRLRDKTDVRDAPSFGSCIERFEALDAPSEFVAAAAAHCYDARLQEMLDEEDPDADQAEQLFSRLKQRAPQYPRLAQAQDIAARIRRVASQRNFYKDLGVAKGASEREITRAYHRIARECHPDRLAPDASDEERAANERRFQRAAEAREVLTDPEKRARYDRGEYFDEQRQQGPFAGGFGGFPGGFHFMRGGNAGGFRFEFK